MRAVFFASLALLAGTACADAKDVLATTDINGRPAQLFDDYTWAYADSTSASSSETVSSSMQPTPTGTCRDIRAGVQFCGDESRWQFVANPAGETAAQFRHDDASYGEYIVEAIGTDNGMTLDAMQGLVLQNAAHFANINTSDVKLVETTPETVTGGDQAVTVVYAVPYKGLTFVFANTIVLNAKRETQVVTFTVDKDYSDADRALHKEFLAATKFN